MRAMPPTSTVPNIPSKSTIPTRPDSASVSNRSEWALRTNPLSVAWRAHQYSNVPAPSPRSGCASNASTADFQYW